MKNLNELREERNALIAKAQALANLAKQDNRELTAEEKTEIDGIIGIENKGGKVAELNQSIARVERLEAEQSRVAVELAQQANKPQSQNNTRIDPIPYKGRLEGYASAEDAYVAGKWAAATILNDVGAQQWCRDKGVLANVMTTGDNTKGGALIIPQVETAIIQLFEQYNSFLTNADRVDMTTSEYQFVSEDSAFTATWVSETPAADAVTASDLNLRTHTVVAKPLQAFTYVSKDLNADSPYSIANLVSQSMARAFNKAIDQAGFLGDSTSTYGGHVGLKNALAAGSVHTAAAGNTAFSTLDDQDFLDMMGKLPDYAKANAKWYISPEGYYASMARLQRAAGGNTVADLGNGPVLQYAGKEVVLSNSCNTTLTTQASATGLCYLGDLSLAAKVGVRSGMEMMVYRELYARQRQIGLEGTIRVGIAVHSVGTASVPGAILALATPGS